MEREERWGKRPAIQLQKNTRKEGGGIDKEEEGKGKDIESPFFPIHWVPLEKEAKGGKGVKEEYLPGYKMLRENALAKKGQIKGGGNYQTFGVEEDWRKGQPNSPGGQYVWRVLWKTTEGGGKRRVLI